MKFKQHTLCWSCAKACGDCAWSDHNLHEPVPGWTAEPAIIKCGQQVSISSFYVLECPEYERDATDDGTKRLKKVQAW